MLLLVILAPASASTLASAVAEALKPPGKSVLNVTLCTGTRIHLASTTFASATALSLAAFVSVALASAAALSSAALSAASLSASACFLAASAFALSD